MKSSDRIELPSDDLIEYLLTLAKESEHTGELPVVAILYQIQSDGKEKILSTGQNRILADSDPTAHAEIIAIRNYCKMQSSERIPGTRLLVTLEPCMMCTGALTLARVDAVFYMTPVTRWVGMSQLLQMHGETLNHTLKAVPLPKGEVATELLQTFFKSRRGKGDDLFVDRKP